MKISIIPSTLLCAMCAQSTVAYSATEEALEKKIEALELRLTEVEKSPANQSMRQPVRQTSDNSFNPAISVILEGAYASYKNKPEDYVLPGYALGGEAELAAEGFSLGHSELILSSRKSVV